MKTAQLNVRVSGQFASGLDMYARVLTNRAYGAAASKAEIVRLGVINLIEAELQEAESWLAAERDGSAVPLSVQVVQARWEAGWLVEAWLLTSGGDATLAEARWPLCFRLLSERGVMIA